MNAFPRTGHGMTGNQMYLLASHTRVLMIIKSLRASTTGFAIIAGRGILISLACRRFASTFGTGVMIRDRRDRVASSANSLRLLTTITRLIFAVVTPRLMSLR